VHLSYASTGGEQGLTPLRDAMRAVAEPAVDTTGPSDAATLSGIHLDPQVAVPHRGTGRWLGPLPAGAVAGIFAAARIGQPDGLALIELRHVDTAAPARDGALTRPPGPLLLHAVGAADGDQRRADVDSCLARVETAARPADLGRAAPSFRDGQPGPADAYGTRTSPAGPGRRAHRPRSGLRLPARSRPAPEPRNRFAVTRVFGAEQFQNEICWERSGAKNDSPGPLRSVTSTGTTRPPSPREIAPETLATLRLAVSFPG
jgi:hypothetical protein